MNKKLFVGLVVVGLVLGSLLFRQSSKPAEQVQVGSTQYDVAKFIGDVYQGLNEQLMFRNGFFVGPASSTATSSFLGATYIKTPVLSTGVTTLTATATTTSLTAAQICAGGGVINWAPPVANATATLPTANALRGACLPTVGNSISVRFRNTSSTSSYNLVAGTGMTIFHMLEVATSTANVNTISSSTPAEVKIFLTLASSTDSTAAVDVIRRITP